jgi:eukaryotic-like serine/threonine-protein kinase
MLIASDSQLVAALADAQLLEEDQLDELTHSLQERFPDPRDLTAHLTLNGWLTAYQAHQLLLGRAKQLRIGPYRLLEKLGEGGMGEVFKARHDHLRRTVALKVISNQHLTNERILERFRREAEAAAQLTHPNIVTMFDAGQIGDTHFLAMEFIDGIDLGRLVDETGRLPVAQACDYIRQAALGLHHAHDRGLVHRDVKPANLLVKAPDRNGHALPVSQDLLAARGAASLFEGGTVKLLDLGMARR